MALYATEGTDFGYIYGNEVSRRPLIYQRYRSHGLKTDRPVGNARYRNNGTSQNGLRFSGSHMQYPAYESICSFPSYDPLPYGHPSNIAPISARKFAPLNYKDVRSLQSIYNPSTLASARLAQHEKKSVFTNNVTRGVVNTDRPNTDRIYGTDIKPLIDSKRYAPFSYRSPQTSWNVQKESLPSEYELYHRIPKNAISYMNINNHSAYNTGNNSNYISEPRLYATQQISQKSGYIPNYANDSSIVKQNQRIFTDRRNCRDTFYNVPYRSVLNAGETNGYRTKSFPSVSLNNINNLETRVYDKNDDFHSDASNCADKDEGIEEDVCFAERDPVTPITGRIKFEKYLTAYEKEEILFYPEIYFVGKYAKKRQPTKNSLGSGTKDHNLQSNNIATKGGSAVTGYDDSKSGYIIVLNDHIAYRYEILNLLGKGSFGQVVHARDHKTGEDVALKIIRSEERFARQAKEEIRILQKLNEEDSNNEHNIVRLLENFKFRGHVCMVFELLSLNLYELLSSNEYRGLRQVEVCGLTKGILECLELLYRNEIIHCDLKPENVLLQYSGSSTIKVIDFGSSCPVNGCIYTYIQSRFYRAPEVILEMSYGMEIDMWSLGCIVAELITGTPLFPGEDKEDQLSCIMELLGTPPACMLAVSKEAHKFFTSTGEPRYLYEQEQEMQREQQLNEVRTNGGGSGTGEKNGRDPSMQFTNGSHRIRAKYKRRSTNWRPRKPPGSMDLLTALTSPRTSSVCVPGAEKRNRRQSRSNFTSVETVDPDMLDFISRCLLWWPEDRMNPIEALQHPWIVKNKTKINLDRLYRSSQAGSLSSYSPPEKDIGSDGVNSTTQNAESAETDDLLRKMEQVRLRRPKMFAEDELRRDRRNSQILRPEPKGTDHFKRYSNGHEYGRYLASLPDQSNVSLEQRSSIRDGRRVNGRQQFRDFLNNDQDTNESLTGSSQQNSADSNVIDVQRRHRPRRPSNRFRDSLGANGLRVDDSRSRVSGNYDSTL